MTDLSKMSVECLVLGLKGQLIVFSEIDGPHVSKAQMADELARRLNEQDAAIARLREQLRVAREGLEQYADAKNWGYYDDSGCDKGHGQYTDACFVGPDPARDTLTRLDHLADPNKKVQPDA